MNRLLLDQFELAKGYPEGLKDTLRDGHSCKVAYSPSVWYLASGRRDGVVTIFDLDTCRPITRLEGRPGADGHTGAIKSLQWSEDGRYLLTAGEDWRCCIWDLSKAAEGPVHAIDFGSAIHNAILIDKDPRVFLVALVGEKPRIVDFRGPEVSIKVAEISCVSFVQRTADGEHYLFCGEEGTVTITGKDLEIQKTFKICNNRIESFELALSSPLAVANSKDRCLWVLSLPNFNDHPDTWQIDTVRKFQDVINKSQWQASGISPDGEFLAGIISGTNYISLWTSCEGAVQQVYHADEVLGDIVYHPSRPQFVSVGLETGAVYVFSIEFTQKWSALSGDFYELQFNELHVEAEDEFDIIDPKPLREDLEREQRVQSNLANRIFVNEAEGLVLPDHVVSNTDHHIDMWSQDLPVTSFIIPIDLANQ